MSLDANWTITPAEVLAQAGWEYKKKGAWYVLPICPYCHGGNHHDTGTFAVHSKDGNYFCKRGSCDRKGTFWGLLLFLGADPKEYLGERLQERPKKQPKKGYIYGR